MPFAQLDVIFQSIAEVALQSRPAGAAEGAEGSIMSAEGDLLWLGALMLLLGTVGVLIVARMALALMLVLGPIFIVLALFSGTRGLFVGWLRTVVMLAVTPLFAVLLGSGTIALIRPLVRELAQTGGQPDMRIAVNIFLAASVHVALMLMALNSRRRWFRDGNCRGFQQAVTIRLLRMWVRNQCSGRIWPSFGCGRGRRGRCRFRCGGRPANTVDIARRRPERFRKRGSD